ncbi:MAG: hypothetical protein MPEBLZ_02114, partial [Candidatus Methanoperedens nitroreducens]
MKDKIAVFSAILLGMVVGLFATISLIIDAFFIGNLVGILIDLIIIVFSYMTAWIGVRHILMQKIANDKMDKEWDYKIKPIMNMLTDTVGRINAMETQVMQTNRRVDTTRLPIKNASIISDIVANKPTTIPSKIALKTAILSFIF